MAGKKIDSRFRSVRPFVLRTCCFCAIGLLGISWSARAFEIPDECLPAFDLSLALSPDMNAKKHAFTRDGRLVEKSSGKRLVAKELLGSSAVLEFDEYAVEDTKKDTEADSGSKKTATLHFKQKIEIKRIDFSHFEISYDRKAKEVARLTASGQLGEPNSKIKLENVQDTKQIETFEFKNNTCLLTQVKQKDATSYYVEFDRDLCQKWLQPTGDSDLSASKKLDLLAEASARVKHTAQHVLYSYDFIDDDDHNRYRFLAQTDSCKKYSSPQVISSDLPSKSQNTKIQK